MARRHRGRGRRDGGPAARGARLRHADAGRARPRHGLPRVQCGHGPRGGRRCLGDVPRGAAAHVGGAARLRGRAARLLMHGRRGLQVPQP